MLSAACVSAYSPHSRREEKIQRVPNVVFMSKFIRNGVSGIFHLHTNTVNFALLTGAMITLNPELYPDCEITLELKLFLCL